jgi:outer membrane protein assembly factor BamE
MRILALPLLALLLPGCGLLYQQPIQQGNLFEPGQVDALKPGMTKRQVALVLGTPAIQSPFHEDRWEYISTLKEKNRSELKRLTVVFEDNVLVRIEGDYEVGKAERAGTDPEGQATGD